MQSAVIAAFFHCCSSNQNPMHGQCPTGKDSWCKYKKALCDGRPLYPSGKDSGLVTGESCELKPSTAEDPPCGGGGAR
ncbi:hypothetical protein TNCV_1442731 [Trichonephila clavipes]|nr:hypothetical protein TNCV_1442731 [Trichonephila clavipes]